MRSIALLLLVPAVASAGSVPATTGGTDLVTFSNGTVADANAVNANFSLLKGAVNDNDARLDALEVRDGSSPTKAAASCRDLDTLNFPSGTYWVDATPATPAGALQVYCDNETDGGGWMLVAQMTPVTNAGASLCVDGAVGALTLDELTVPQPAKLAKATIDAFWGPTKEVLMKTSFDTGLETRAAWTEACVLDFKADATWPLSTGALPMAALESTTARCLKGSIPATISIGSVHPNAGSAYCNVVYSSVGDTRFFIFSGYTSFSGGSCTGNAGRTWPGSTGNSGCNVAKWFIR